MNPALRAAVYRSIALWVCLSFAPGVALAEGGPAVVPSHAASSPATGPCSAPASQPCGKWTCWTQESSLFFGPQASTPGALWFCGFTSGHIWRYDLKSEKIQVFSALDGLPLDEGAVCRIATASDERCAVLFSRNDKGTLFLWEPKTGWRALPPIGDHEFVRDIGFDANDRLLALHARGKQCVISRLDGKTWREECVVPESRELLPLTEGYLVADFANPITTVTYVPAKDTDRFSSETGQPLDSSFLYYFRCGDKTLCLATEARERIMRRDKGFELTPAGFHESLVGKYIGLDLKAGGFLDCRVIEMTDEHVIVEPQIPDAPRIDLRFDTSCSFQPIRDPNGHLWVGRRRWDGRQWKTFSSGFELPGSAWNAHDSNRVRLSDDGTKWSLVNPDLPTRAAGYDAAERTAWIPTSYTGKGELRLTRFADSKKEVIRSVPYDDYLGEPEFRAPNGDWWWRGCNTGPKKGILRLTSAGIREYPQQFAVFLSPQGHVWCLGPNNAYSRYDAATDAFVSDDPLEEFAFDFGKWRLSYVPGVSNPTLYMKTAGEWAPFRTPFSTFDASVYKNPIYKDRLLVAVADIGVLEYNATLNKWARLSDVGWYPAFDYRGRRLLAGCCLLVFDGDPWAGMTPEPADEALFARLLKQMDDDKWKVRDETTALMSKNMVRFHNRIVAAADSPLLSLEVRERLKNILPVTGATPAPPPLFRTMHPLLAIPK